MSRLERRNRKDINVKNSGGLFDLVDNVIKLGHRINDEEYEYMAEKMSEDEISLFTNDKPSFSEMRQMLVMVDRYLGEYHKR